MTGEEAHEIWKQRGTFNRYICHIARMGTKHRKLLLWGMLVVATAGLVMQRQRASCLGRQVLRLGAICVPGDARHFDVFDGGLVLVSQLCHADPLQPNCLTIQAGGKWVNGRLDTTSSDSGVRYRAVEADKTICELRISDGLAVRTVGETSNDIPVRWPTCSSADVWRDAATLGYRLPTSAKLQYSDNGLSLTLYDADGDHWTVSTSGACIGDPANPVQSDRTLQPMSLLARMRLEEKDAANSVAANLALAKSSQRDEVIAASRRGCRAPTEADCAKCCVSRADGCDRFHWNGAGVPTYDLHEKLESPCDPNCRPCATCTKADERLLKTYAPRQGCDCRQPDGIDPCFSADSCACYCKHLRPLLLGCPGQRDQQ